MEEIYETNDIDVLLLGSSHTDVSFDEKILSDMFHKNVFNAGTPVQKPDVSYYILKEALKNNEIDCLLIPKGEIVLDGYNYGFIGGASVKLNNKEILFFGDFADNNTKQMIINFLLKYNMNALFIENKKLTDIGSAIIL